MCFTKVIQNEITTWEKELHQSNIWLRKAKQKEILEFLNKPEYLCTPGFILRRQIQALFPQLMQNIHESLKGVPIPKNLATAGNVAWDKKFINALSNRLATMNLNLDAQQWKNCLTDKTLCQRQTAIKLIFALDMDDKTAAKFLISSGHSLLNVRNPFDYICKFCLSFKPALSYTDAGNILRDFETRRPQPNKTISQNRQFGMTRELTSEIIRLVEDDTITADDKKERLIVYMLKNESEFVRKTSKGYPSGFSLQNIRKLKILIKYLAIIYPKEIVANNEKEEVSIPLDTDAEGVPTNYENLMSAMYYFQDIDFPDHLELNLPEKGAQINAFYNIPFNKDVLVRLKKLATTLQAIMRAEKNSANVQDINRSTIMILAYFLITGYLYANETLAGEFVTQLKKDLLADTNTEEKKLLQGLQRVTANLEKIVDSQTQAKLYIESLNWILKSFDFTEFYPPFILDRFILICLLADPLGAPIRDVYEKSLTFLMQLVIAESYNLSKEMLEEQNEKRYSTTNDKRRSKPIAAGHSDN